MVKVFGSLPCNLKGTCFRFRITSVASSTTPLIEENSCSTPSIFTAVIAAPSIDESSARRSELDRKSTRLNSSHLGISYAVFCLQKKKPTNLLCLRQRRRGHEEHYSLPLS